MRHFRGRTLTNIFPCFFYPCRKMQVRKMFMQRFGMYRCFSATSSCQCVSGIPVLSPMFPSVFGLSAWFIGLWISFLDFPLWISLPFGLFFLFKPDLFWSFVIVTLLPLNHWTALISASEFVFAFHYEINHCIHSRYTVTLVGSVHMLTTFFFPTSPNYNRILVSTYFWPFSVLFYR